MPRSSKRIRIWSMPQRRRRSSPSGRRRPSSLAVFGTSWPSPPAAEAATLPDAAAVPAVIGEPEAESAGSGILRRVLAEFLGTALLLVAVVGSGIAAQRLSPGNVGLQLFENSTATAGALVAIILALGPISGAHLNPVVTLADRLFGGVLSWRIAIAYWAAQVLGAVGGAIVANLMFSLPAVEVSTKVRSGGGVWLGEVIATFGLLLVIFGVIRSGRSGAVPFAVAAYIAGAYWFTSSTSSANPAVTLARTLSNTFAGISPGSAPAFIGAQLLGAALAVLVIRMLFAPR
jgi:glycerol uptake facilitator-like aquaporin